MTLWGRAQGGGQRQSCRGHSHLTCSSWAWLSWPVGISISEEEVSEGHFSPFIPLQTLGFQPKVPTVQNREAP